MVETFPSLCRFDKANDPNKRTGLHAALPICRRPQVHRCEGGADPFCVRVNVEESEVRQQEVEKYARGLLSWNADFALSHAASRADLFAKRGDEESAAAWLNVQNRIRKLQTIARPTDNTRNLGRV